MYTIEKQLVPIQQKPLLESRFIIAHESGNPANTGKNALLNEVSYMSRKAEEGGSFTSHWVGSGGRIIQIAQTGKIQYGAGAKANPYAFAQVELARTTDKKQFAKDYLAYVWLLRQLAAEASIPFTLNTGHSIEDKGIKTHHWVSRNLGGTTHTDPDNYLASFGVTIVQFARDLSKGASSSSKEPVSQSHLVKRGDTLWSIAEKYQTTVQYLVTINHLPSEVIYTGQMLRLKKDSTITNSEIITQIQRTIGTEPDGRFGPNTKTALLKLYQRTYGIYPTGIWNDSLSLSVRVLRSGSKGWDVYAVQALLYCLNYKNVGALDKMYGPKTESAVRSFQKQHHLQVDGIFGPKTQKKLFS
ncbi:MAG: peptidoglycan-binding protein [Desemzia incerta]